AANANADFHAILFKLTIFSSEANETISAAKMPASRRRFPPCVKLRCDEARPADDQGQSTQINGSASSTASDPSAISAIQIYVIDPFRTRGGFVVAARSLKGRFCMKSQTIEIDEMVSLERGEIDRRIYSDPAIFELEMERIFARAWLFLCHESQIPEPGDFFQSVMGRDNVLVVRQKDRTVKAMLNTCAHRGNAVCRAEEGNAKSFLCTYHGWSYGIDGQLLGVPGFKTFYNGELDKSKHGLAQVAQVGRYKGFIFGTHDISAPPLEQFLGATGRLGLDMIAARGDMVVVPGIQKFIIDCNWKIAVDNLFDWYHPQITHASAFLPGVLGTDPGRTTTEKIDMSDVNMDNGGALDMPDIGISGTKFD